MLSVRTGIAPQALWEADTRDLATMIDVLEEQNRKGRRRR